MKSTPRAQLYVSKTREIQTSCARQPDFPVVLVGQIGSANPVAHIESFSARWCAKAGRPVGVRHIAKLR